MLPRTNHIPLPPEQAQFVEQCPGNKICCYAEHCKTADVFKNCGMFRRLVLEKLNLTSYPDGANLDYLANLAFGRNN